MGVTGESEVSLGPCNAVCILCFLLVLAGFLCRPTADRDVIRAPASGLLTNKHLGKEKEVAQIFLCSEHRPACQVAVLVT